MSPRNKNLNDAARQASIERILNACLDLFSRQGYAATSVSQVAREAGVSKGLIYNYFESKLEMLKALFSYFFQEEEAIMKDVVDEDPQTFLHNIIRVTCSEVQQKKDIWRMVSAMSMQPDMYAFINEIAVSKRAQYHGLLEDLLHRLGYEEPAGEARLISATLDGIAVQFLVSGEVGPVKEIESFLIKKYSK